jgi:hypothetical protein
MTQVISGSGVMSVKFKNGVKHEAGTDSTSGIIDIGCGAG